MNKVERDQHRRDMKHPRTRIRRVLTAPLMDGEVSIAAEHKKWHDAFGAVVADILAGKHHMKRHSDGETPWQFALADYRVLFSDKTPRGTERKDGGSWGDLSARLQCSCRYVRPEQRLPTQCALKNV